MSGVHIWLYVYCCCVSDVVYRYYSYYGYGNGTIWMNYVYCDGSEDRLIDCSIKYDTGFGAYYCGHDEIAGVYCPCKLI